MTRWSTSPLVTTMPVCEPVTAGTPWSLAVMLRVPAVSKVAEKVPLPLLVRLTSLSGNTTLESLEVKTTVPA